jgi:hypothetical protein
MVARLRATETFRNMSVEDRQDAAIAAILTTSSLKEAAREAGIPPSTFYRLTNTPEFQAALKAARVQVFDNAMARLQALANDAVDVVEQTVKGRLRDNTRLRAATMVIENGKAERERDIEARLDEIERRLGL